ncbi:unnamed protein product, partial [marine sediment metagenome]
MKRMFDIAFWTTNNNNKPEKRTVECVSTNDPNTWKGRCPLGTHRDKNPSFYVYLNTNDKYWYCFGCGQSGPLWNESKT